MKRRKFLSGLTTLGLAGVLPQGARGRDANAALTGLNVSVVYDLGGKLDKSFNQSGFGGVLEARRRLGARVTEFEVTTHGDQPDVLRRAARAATDVIVIGAGAREAVADIAAALPRVRFTLLDADVSAPNVSSILFADHEAAFLAGLLAGKVSRTGVVGFIGGAPVPPVLRFLSGFRQGMGFGRAGGQLVETMLGDFPGVWDDPFRAFLVARRLIARNVDVLFAACGGSGIGIYQAAADAGVLAIGVDSNQNHLFPGTMLTSAVKRVDKAVVAAIETIAADTWRPGTRTLGLAEGAVGIAMDDHNAAMVSDYVPLITTTREDIISGRITVAVS